MWRDRVRKAAIWALLAPLTAFGIAQIGQGSQGEGIWRALWQFSLMAVPVATLTAGLTLALGRRIDPFVVIVSPCVYLGVMAAHAKGIGMFLLGWFMVIAIVLLVCRPLTDEKDDTTTEGRRPWRATRSSSGSTPGTGVASRRSRRESSPAR